MFVLTHEIYKLCLSGQHPVVCHSRHNYSCELQHFCKSSVIWHGIARFSLLLTLLQSRLHCLKLFFWSTNSMFQVSQWNHHGLLQHVWADVAFFPVFAESGGQQHASAKLHVCVQFTAPTLCFSCLFVKLSLTWPLLILIRFYLCCTCLCASIQQSGYYRLQLSQHAHAKPTLAQALATTSPLSGLPAQVARRLYVVQSTPRPHTWANEREEAAWKVAF